MTLQEIITRRQRRLLRLFAGKYLSPSERLATAGLLEDTYWALALSERALLDARFGLAGRPSRKVGELARRLRVPLAQLERRIAEIRAEMTPVILVCPLSEPTLHCRRQRAACRRTA